MDATNWTLDRQHINSRIDSLAVKPNVVLEKSRTSQSRSTAQGALQRAILGRKLQVESIGHWKLILVKSLSSPEYQVKTSATTKDLSWAFEIKRAIRVTSRLLISSGFSSNGLVIQCGRGLYI